jgi:gluconokinase
MDPEKPLQHPVAIIGLDVGTSSSKAIAVTREGQVLASASRPYGLQHPKPGFAEQDPQLVRDAALACLAEVLAASRDKAEVLSISISTAMHGIMALDEGGRPLTPILTWADTRSQAEAESMLALPEAQLLYATTGVPIHPMSPLCKLAWMGKHQPDIMASARMFAGIKEYLLHYLTGRWIIDYSIASATGLFDILQRTWSPMALSLAGVHKDQLPRPVEGTAAFPMIPDAAAALGYTGLDVFPGASDGCLANLGSGAMEPGLLALTIGTSGAVRMTLPQPATDPEGRLFNYILLPGAFVSGGPVNNGGIILKWFSESILGRPFSSKADVNGFLEAVASVPPGAAGLTCLPWFLGERAPVWNAAATGLFHGCTVMHSREHMMRALVEGISFNLRQVADMLSSQTTPIRAVLASGGFTASPLWVQLIADIFQVPVRCATHEDASATGAAMLGFMGKGMAGSEADFHGWLSTAQEVLPDPAHREAYAQAYARYCAVAAWASQAPLFP